MCRSKRSNVAVHRKGVWNQIPVYKIQNPLPIPMANGIVDIDWYTLPCGGKAYNRFLEKLQPDVIHIHTFMGLHVEFLIAAEEMKIATIYTTHDYFGICPKADMMYGDNVCQHPGMNCETCNTNAFSSMRIVLEQSKIYALYRKNSFLTKMLASDLLKNYFGYLRSRPSQIKNSRKKKECSKEENFHVEKKSYNRYQDLLNYYQNMFNKITYFHFNSSIAHKIYEKHLGMLPGEVIGVSNRNVYDRRQQKKFGKQLRIGFLGGDNPYKGLNKLYQAVAELYKEGLTDIELHIYGSKDALKDVFCKYHAPYSPDELEQVFSQIDLLAVPSHGTETFGMVVLEALSFGIPVLMTDMVGAQDILLASQQIIGKIVPDTIEGLKAAIMDFDLNRSKLSIINENILQADLQFDYMKYVEQIRQMYGRCKAYQS